MNQSLLSSISKITKEEQGLLDGGALHREIYTGNSGFTVDSKRMLKRGQLIEIRPHTRFTEFPAHSHNFVEIMYVCKGKVCHVVNSEISVTLSEGEILLLNRHAVHSIKAAGADDVAVNFIILPEFFDYALGLIGYENLLGQFLISSLQSGSSTVDFLKFQVSNVMVIQNLMENLIWSILNEQGNNRRINQVTMGLLFLQLLNYVEISHQPGTAAGHALVMEAMKEIEENYTAANLSMLAQAHDVSVSYVSRLVRESTGASFKELLQEKRLTKAAQLLTETKLTVSEIIEAVGYDNTSYFHKIFKNKYAVSPRAYRIQTEDEFPRQKAAEEKHGVVYGDGR